MLSGVSNRQDDLDRFYALIDQLNTKIRGPYCLSTCDGTMGWPNRGVYFFFEPGELRKDGKTPRIVRVGTHAVSKGSKATLWSRLRTHRGHLSGGGNHRGSVFRLLVGSALIKRREYGKPAVVSWGIGNSAPRDIRHLEQGIEQDVTQYIGKMPFVFVSIDDEPGAESRRKYIERNSIGLLSVLNGCPDVPSSNWLGLSCIQHEIRESGLWNSDHVRDQYNPAFLNELAHYIDSQNKDNWICDNSKDERIYEIMKKDDHIPISNWVATVILKSNLEISHEKDQCNNPIRISEMECILRETLKKTTGDGVILFPGGWVHTQHEKAETIYPTIEQSVRNILTLTKRDIKVCIGIDGCFSHIIVEEAYDKDQMAIVIDRTGIIAISRKFYPTDKSEEENIQLSKNYKEGELGKPRIFELNGVRYFPFVCHDIYGPFKKSEKYPNPGIHVGLNIIHRFRPRGQHLSREDYFPKFGWSEASYQWQIPIFGTSIFFRRKIPIPDEWPTGVFWKSGEVWREPKIEDIALPCDLPIISIPLVEGFAEIRIFTDISGKIESLKGSQISDFIAKLRSPKKEKYSLNHRARDVFNQIITQFQINPDLPKGIKRNLLRKNQCRFSFPQWYRVENSSNKSIFYEFNDWMDEGKSEISVEIEFWCETFSDIGDFIQLQKGTLAKKMPGGPTVVWDTSWSPGWGRLKFIFSDDQDPEIIAKSMLILIQETKETVNNWLISKKMEHY